MKGLLVLCLMASTSAFANYGLSGKCKGVDLSADQKTAIKKVLLETKLGSIELQSEIKAAKLAKKKVVENVNSTKEEASDAASALSAAMAKVQALKAAAQLQVSFDILTGEQRVKLLKCGKKGQMRRGHHARRGQTRFSRPGYRQGRYSRRAPSYSHRRSGHGHFRSGSARHH